MPDTAQPGPSAGPSGPSTQPPMPSSAKHPHPHHAGPHHHPQRTPRQTEEGVLILVAHSPEYYAALSRTRRRFWGTLFWAFLIYLVAVWVLLLPVGL
ncbi:hypothetical protein CC85DRAFT_287819 [Cutaneotrichosporon oleaginosum]|uniref:Uncharacterized protein n=1 Tax=Cutaneotrichosporon oleaginosum TaxID=879819 RepID=A0A0J1AXR9_9TREE|nr:uncharacterized protein CC85DRAFT_287819 [Cutaneotrichosporon oleaginosum]KLT40109.1 hypothetical protein CC85DRAFT_287819 [Cutaneotrichosporon oleaginosum]TXT04748.1 hypothetical protein COLE_07567 [Cutaneotrichosporon oleaginosum]